MTFALDRVDTSPIANSSFDPKFFVPWLWVLVDLLNENFNQIELAFNLLTAMSYTQTDIMSMFTAGQLGNGVLLYDSTNDVYVGMQAGVLVKFQTTTYP